jgi:hypothetical protein|tara:strand:- start:3316 stop:3432 length:117 start_codon:yes stop_codon:yes gene_type:complete
MAAHPRAGPSRGDRGWARALGATTTTATTREAIVDATR